MQSNNWYESRRVPAFITERVASERVRSRFVPMSWCGSLKFEDEVGATGPRHEAALIDALNYPELGTLPLVYAWLSHMDAPGVLQSCQG